MALGAQSRAFRLHDIGFSGESQSDCEEKSQSSSKRDDIIDETSADLRSFLPVSSTQASANT